MSCSCSGDFVEFLPDRLGDDFGDRLGCVGDSCDTSVRGSSLILIGCFLGAVGGVEIKIYQAA